MPSNTFEASLPAARTVAAAALSKRALAALLSTQAETQQIQIFDEKNEAHALELPMSALRLLVDILAELADGNAVKVVTVHAELTTQEAADLLHVSRPHLVKLLEAGHLPFHKTGKHRRVRFSDLSVYKAKQEQASVAAMDELAVQAQALQLGYPAGLLLILQTSLSTRTTDARFRI
jgi:excisionase family DNA binding protein